jgi:hypothetical protein
MNESLLPTAELDAMHNEAKAAFGRRDLSKYRELFAPTLTYRQADGRIIDRDQLMRDVRVQFRRLSRVHSSFVREHIESDGDRVTEVLTQTASFGATAFLVVHRTWELSRKGRYTWGRHGGRWLIEAVEVIEEHVSKGRFSIGFSPPSVVEGESSGPKVG